jgi:hypothetical protein
MPIPSLLAPGSLDDLGTLPTCLLDFLVFWYTLRLILRLISIISTAVDLSLVSDLVSLSTKSALLPYLPNSCLLRGVVST